MEYDIVIVGGGPAGLMAAKTSASSNVNVLLIEKYMKFGVKPCGEGFLDMGFKIIGVSPKPKFIDTKVDGAWIYPPNSSKGIYISSKEAGISGFIVEKPRLLRFMASEAVESGADIMMGAEVIDISRINDEFINLRVRRHGDLLNIKAKIVLGCGGTNCIIARRIFNIKRRDLIPAVQYKMANVNLDDKNAIYIWFSSKYAPSGYLWIFPKGDREANVGVGCKGKGIEERLRIFIKKHPDIFRKAKIVEIGSGVIDVSGPASEIVKEGIMICGEAAGHVVPLTGEGNGPSALAGKIAGGIASEAVVKDDISIIKLSEYPEKFKNEKYYRMIKVGLKIKPIFEGLSDNDLNELFSIISKKEFIKIFHGEDISALKFGLKLMRYPKFAIKLLKKRRS